MSYDILLTQIDPDPDQPRKHFDQAGLEELAQSIKANGLAVPVLLRPAAGRFIIVHGERRYRAALLLGWETIPAEVREIDPEAAHWLALVENVQRSDLSPIEEAEAYKARLDSGMTQEQLGQRIGKTQSYIAQKLRLLTLPAPVQLYLNRGAIGEGHARQLLKLKGIYPDQNDDRYQEWAKQRLSEKMPEIEAWWLLSFPLLRDIRPEDWPVCWFMDLIPKNCNWGDDITALSPVEIDALRAAVDENEHRQKILLMAEGCRLFDQYICENDGIIPVWTVGAFWWASCAAHTGCSVGVLTRLINGWKRRFYTAVMWAEIIDLPEDKAKSDYDKLRELEYWGYRSDLRHAGVSIEQTRNSGLVEAAANELAPMDFRLAPSICQPWGAQGKEYKNLVGRERERWEKYNYA